MKVFLVPTNMDIVIASYGGTGTTFFMEFLSTYKKINHLYDGGNLKHTAFPPFSINPSQKFVYLFGDPVHATISLFLRNYQYLQSIKIQEAAGIKSPIPQTMTLEEYAAEGVDKFKFRHHFFNWYNSSSPNQILFVRYETLFDNLSKIFDFLELPPSAIAKFPQKKDRESKSSEISNKTLTQLQKMYGEFQNELENIPDIELRGGKKLNAVKKLFNLSKFYSIYGISASRKKVKTFYENRHEK